MTTSNKPPLKLRPPRRCWIEFITGTVIAGPYVLEPKPKPRPKPKKAKGGRS